jgi:hypothetical protein
MATANFTDAQTYEFQPYDHKDFSKIASSIPTGHFEGLSKMTVDIAGGLNVIIEMLEQNSLDKECNGPHYLTPTAEGNLFRLAARTSEMLHKAACDAIDMVEKHHGISKP